MNFIDLFAGAGGLSEGFIRAGHTPIAHVEIDEAASNTLKTRAAFHHLEEVDEIDLYESYLKGELSRADFYSKIPKQVLSTVINKPIGTETNDLIYNKIDSLIGRRNVDLLIGGPPCQAYSVIGRARDEFNMAFDERNYLYRQYAKYLLRYRPRFFVFENVLGLATAKGGAYLKNMIKYFKQIGYEVEWKKLNAADFGVLQKRRRILIFGWQKGINFNYPTFEPDEHNYTVQNIFEDLPELEDGDGQDKNGAYTGNNTDYLHDYGIRNGIPILTQHVTRPHTNQDKEIYDIAVTKWNRNKERLVYSDLPGRLRTHNNIIGFLDRFKVVAADEPASHTVVAHIAKDGHHYIHPDIEQNRSISVREAARLQSFPDDYYFEGVKEDANRTAAFKQIGNAVPPLMAQSIAQKIEATN